MRSGSGLQEPQPPEGVGAQLPQAAVNEICHVEDLPIRRELDVLGRGVRGQRHGAHQALGRYVHDDHPGGEFAADQHVAAICGEVSMVQPRALRHAELLVKLHRAGQAEVDAA